MAAAAVTRWLTVLLAAALAYGQTGAVIDVRLSGTPEVENARITLWPPGITMPHEAGGAARFAELTAGAYRIEVTADGCRSIDTSCVVAAGDYALLRLTAERLRATLPEVIVETKRREAGIRQFSQSDIRQSRAANLPAFLEKAAGLEIQTDGTAGAPASVRIGGSNSDQVLVLVDNKPLQSGGGSADLSSLPLEWIETITIHRGGQTEHGGEAIGGIIEITTRSADGPTEQSVGADGYSTYYRASVLRTQRFGRIGGLLSYVRMQGPGNFEYRISEDDGTGEFTPDLGATYRRQNSDIVRDQALIKLEGSHYYLDYAALTGQIDRSARGMPGYLAPQLTPLARQSTADHGLNLRFGKHYTAIALDGRGSYQGNWREFRNPDPFSRVPQTTEASRRMEGEGRGHWRNGPRSVQAGFLAGNETLNSNQIAGGNARRDRWEAWLLARHMIPGTLLHIVQADIEPGIRAEGFGAERVILPRVALNAAHTGRHYVTAQAAWGKSYRAPSFYSLFWVDDQVSAGNPDLAAERSTEVTGRISYASAARNALRLDVSVSDQRIEGLIFWRKGFDNRWKPFNLKSARVRTLDAAVEQTLAGERLRLSSGANWTEARDATDDRNTGGRYLTFRAAHSFRAGGVWSAGGWRFTGNYRYVAARPVLETNSKWLAPYALVDAEAAYGFQLRRLRIEAAIGVDNILNENYRIIRHAPMPLREWHAGLRLAQF